MSNNTTDAPKRVNEVLENYKAYKENRDAFMGKFANRELAKINEKKEFLAKVNKIRENRLAAEQEHGKLLNEAKDYYFKNALKGIYIGALEASTLSDEALFVAESMVDDYVTENNGYAGIMQKVDADTYLLAKIRRLVEDAAEEEVENIEKEKEDIDNIEDIEMQDAPEDEKDSIEVEDKSEITTANIEDIVNALNQAGMEVVKKDDADNFKEELPETPENSPEADAPADLDMNAAPGEENKPEETEVETGDDDKDTNITVTGDNSEVKVEVEDDDKEEAPETDAPADDTTTSEEPAAAPEENVEEAPATDDAAEEENKEEESEEEDDLDLEEDEDEDELSKDLEDADKIEDEKEESEEDDFEDTMDPDSVAIQDDEDEESEDDSDLDELGDEDEDFSDEGFEDDEEGSDDAIDIDGDGDPDVGDIEEPEATVNVDPNKTMMDELENEKEIKDAIELIRTRVADAEEAFIKRNQEDKQQIDDLLSKISQNVATVEKISANDSNKADEAKKNVEESTRMYKQQIDSIVSDKQMSIFDKMTRNISESIVKDPVKVKMFINESTGTPDMAYIVETSKVMYAFLETLNTLQLENVNSPYITKIINDIK